MPSINMTYLNWCYDNREILTVILDTKYSAWIEGYYFGRSLLFSTLRTGE